jgi:hypothetical protein
MVRPVYVAYLLLLGALALIGFFLDDTPWWVLVLIGSGAMALVALADIVTTRRASLRR